MTMMEAQTGDSNIDEKLAKLIEAIDLNNLEDCKNITGDLLILCISNAPLAKWITIPSNLRALQELLATTFDIDHRQFQLKTRVASRQRRAILFLKAISIALGRIDHNDHLVPKSNS